MSRKRKKSHKTTTSKTHNGFLTTDTPQLFSNWDWILLLALVVVSFAFYWGHFTGKSFLWFDGLFQVLPRKKFIAEALAHGRIPLWCPYMIGGVPFLADPTNSPFYIFHFLLPLFTLLNNGAFDPIWLNYMIIVQTLFCAIATYLLLRRVISFHPLSAFFSTVAFLFCTAATVRTIQYAHYTVIVFIPPVLLMCAHLRNTSWKWLLLTTVTVALCLFGDNHQYVYYLFIAMGFMFIVDAAPLIKTPKKLAVLFLKYAFIGIGAVALSAILLLPMVEYTHIAQRAFEKPSGAPVKYLVTYLAPFFFGKITDISRQYFGHEGFWNYWEISMYVGIPTLILAGMSFFFSRSRMMVFAVILILFSFIYAFGTNNPLPQLLPLGGSMRIPSKILIFAAWGFALLAGYTVNALLTKKIAFKKFLIAFITSTGFFVVAWGVTIAVIASIDNDAHKTVATNNIFRAGVLLGISAAIIYFSYTLRTLSLYLIIALCTLLVWDLFNANKDFPAGHTSYSEFFAERDFVKAWQNERKKGPFRIDGGPYTTMNLRPLYFELEGLTGFSALSPPAFKKFRALKKLNPERYYQLLNVRYIISQRGISTLPSQLPRTFIVPELRVADEDAIPSALADKNFSPLNAAFVTPEYASFTNAYPASPTASAEIQSYENENISIDVSSPNPGFLIILDPPYPGWKAYVNDSETEWTTVNINSRAVPIPQGNSTVTWKFQPDSYTFGSYITLAASVIMVLIFFLSSRLPRISI